jgi:ATP-dependent DNA helicase RecG
MEGLSNQDIRQITLFDRHQVFRLMNELRQENPEISEPGKGKGARYEYHSQEGNADPHAQ